VRAVVIGFPNVGKSALILLLSAESKAGKINTTGQLVLRKNDSEKLSIINPL